MVNPATGLEKNIYLAPDGKELRFLSPANNLSILTGLWNNNEH